MMVYSAWQGILISLCLALPILVLFIDDLLLGALATLMIAFVSVSIIGIIPLVGWKLGVREKVFIKIKISYIFNEFSLHSFSLSIIEQFVSVYN